MSSKRVFIKEVDGYWESEISCTGSPCGTFYNRKGEVIAYSSYDYISKITDNANEKQKAYFRKHLRGKQ